MALAPERPSGHVLGLHASGMLTARGVGAALAGAAAEHMPSSTAMALTAAASPAVTLALVVSAPARRG
ncbi:hypothetical protein ACFV9P_19055 [Streptomyces sp. NPDC059892]|uniref:hypothetical protein n=1 Tax=Streptomyces sp. NPDC059892 TaxID=3346989 RepID=UPI00365F5793